MFRKGRRLLMHRKELPRMETVKGAEMKDMNHSTVEFSEYVEGLENSLQKIADLEYCKIPGCVDSENASACRLCAAKIAEKYLEGKS